MAGGLESLVDRKIPIIWGDNFEILKRFSSESVDLIYLDPPFSPDPKYWKIWGQDDEAVNEAYEEACKGGIHTYVSWMRDRVELMHRVLKPTGSFYFHCDWQMGAYFRIMLDEVFGRNNFINEIIWHYGLGAASRRKGFLRKHDNILFYAKSKHFIFNQLRGEITPQMEKKYCHEDEKGKYMMSYGKKYYLKGGKPFDDVWDISTLAATSKERLGYATQKPEVLLERIIMASSNEGDIVLDPFCGCGTTLAVAYKLEREGIGVDLAKRGCELMEQRLSELGASPQIIPWSLKKKQIEMLRRMSGYEFQEWVLLRIGGERRIGPDRGIDLYTSQLEPVQVKKPRVGPGVLRDFRTALQSRGKQRGYIVGFDFTKGAIEAADRYRAKENLEIELVRVEELPKYFD